MISSLRVERDLERQSHQQTRQQAEYHIIELQAQLARRDAELEAYITRTDEFPSPENAPRRNSQFHKDKESGPSVDRHITKEEALRVMEATAAKNKLLELEVQGLFKKVRIYQIYRCPSVVPILITEQLNETRLRKSSQAENVPLASGASISHRASSPPSLFPPLTTKLSFDPHMDSLPRAHQGENDDIQELSSSIPHARPIEDLNYQIAVLSSEIGAFRSERDLLAIFVARERVRCLINIEFIS
jgi:hypothetical protein